MEKIHESNRTAVTQRISMMAMAVIQLGATNEELHDETDINANEPREIELARTLAAAWDRGETIEAWHLPGIQDLIDDPIRHAQRSKRGDAQERSFCQG